jgi:hypothetical protein
LSPYRHVMAAGGALGSSREAPVIERDDVDDIAMVRLAHGEATALTRYMRTVTRRRR